MREPFMLSFPLDEYRARLDKLIAIMRQTCPMSDESARLFKALFQSMIADKAASQRTQAEHREYSVGRRFRPSGAGIPRYAQIYLCRPLPWRNKRSLQRCHGMRNGSF